jgi:hypothetical protein
MYLSMVVFRVPALWYFGQPGALEFCYTTGTGNLARFNRKHVPQKIHHLEQAGVSIHSGTLVECLHQ